MKTLLLFVVFVILPLAVFAQTPAKSRKKEKQYKLPVYDPNTGMVCLDARALAEIQKLLKDHAQSKQEFETKLAEVAREVESILDRIPNEPIPDSIIVIDSREKNVKGNIRNKNDSLKVDF